MSEFLAYVFGAVAIIEGLYIWQLRDMNEQLTGGKNRVQKEADLLQSKLNTLRAKHRMRS